MNKIHVIFPVLNEERRIDHGVCETVRFMDAHFAGRYHITIVDNGSVDATWQMAQDYAARFENVGCLRLNERGVGIAFRSGVQENRYEIVGYMDIDLSTDLACLLTMDQTFAENSQIQIFNASRLSKKSKIVGRHKMRRVTSYGLKYLLKLFFHMKIDDAVCGFKFFRRDALDQLMAVTAPTSGWFYCIELMVRAERMRMDICEVPITWVDNDDTKVKVAGTISNYMKNILRLWKQLHFSEDKTND